MSFNQIFQFGKKRAIRAHKPADTENVRGIIRSTKNMKFKTKFVFGISTPFLCFFLFGISDKGQEFLRELVPTAGAQGQILDLLMGAELAPLVLGLIPFLILSMFGCVFLLLDGSQKGAQ